MPGGSCSSKIHTARDPGPTTRAEWPIRSTCRYDTVWFSDISTCPRLTRSTGTESKRIVVPPPSATTPPPGSARTAKPSAFGNGTVPATSRAVTASRIPVTSRIRRSR